MPGSCTFSGIYLNGTVTATAGPTDTITATLYKNGAATAMSTSISVVTLNVRVSSSDTVNSFAVVAGDTVAIFWSHTNGSPQVNVDISTVCK